MTLISNFDVASALIGASVACVLILAILWPWVQRQQRADELGPPGAPPPEYRAALASALAGAPPPPAAARHALVVDRSAAPIEVRVTTQPCLVSIPPDWKPRAWMADRALCETDESTLQLLPYVVVQNDAGEVLTYSRGKGGAEARLHALRSVGLGGHVDTPPNDYFDGPALMYHLKAEARRELKEEAGLEPHDWELVERGFIVDPTNAVGRVHLGILMTYRAGPHELVLEDGAIEDVRWMSLEDLSAPEQRARLEPWSQVAVSYLMASSAVSPYQIDRHAISLEPQKFGRL